MCCSFCFPAFCVCLCEFVFVVFVRVIFVVGRVFLFLCACLLFVVSSRCLCLFVCSFSALHFLFACVSFFGGCVSCLCVRGFVFSSQCS